MRTPTPPLPISRPTFSLLAAAVLLTLAFSGCATTEQRTAQIQAGMSRAQVIALLGQPRTVVHNGSLEVLNFDLAHQDGRSTQPVGGLYYVILGRDRRVQSFGPS